MSFFRLILTRILKLLQSIAGLCKRALCLMRKRENIGELPFTVVSHSTGQSNPENVSWGNDFQWNEKTIVEDKIDQWRKNKEVPTGSQSDEPDFFNDMIPDIRRTKKAILKPKVSPISPTTKPDLFAFQGNDLDIAPTNELGELEDNAAWDDDLSSTLQEHRTMKIKARHEEYERRMMSKKGIYGQN